MAAKKRKTTRRSKRRLNPQVLVLFFAIVILSYLFAALFLNKYTMDIKLNGDETIYLEYGDPFEDPGATAYERNQFIRFIKNKTAYTVSGDFGNGEIGEYKLTYTAETEHSKGSITRTVIIRDTAAPVLELTENPDSYTPFNHPYEEEGFKAVDKHDGDLTEAVVKEEKDGKVYYSVTDASGNKAEAERTIVYDDRKGPEITFPQGEEIIIQQGSGYNDEFQAVDDVDGDVTSKVSVEGSVDPSVIGDYTLTYKATDEHGNETTVKKTVHVIAKTAEEISPDDRSRYIYLTFDDGPAQYTDELLDILDRLGVKVTFFTTSGYPGYLHCMKRAYEAGHTVAIHTASHDYGRIYSSDEAYWNDFNAQNDAIFEQTGTRTNLFRFPGGSSNTISANYNSGIMSRLVQQAADKGYVYFDWNVSSGDAGETTDTAVVIENVKRQVTANSNAGYASVVLQHDIKKFSVDAVEGIVNWGRENGYIFLPLTAGSPTAHHGVNN